MQNKNDNLSLRARLGLILTARLALVGAWQERTSLRLGRFAAKYTGWIMLFAVAGTLSAVAAVAITEAFVPATLLVLTVGEWELLAAVFYILAILLYLGEGGYRMSSTGRATAPLAPRIRGAPLRQSVPSVEHDASYLSTLEAVEA